MEEYYKQMSQNPEDYILAGLISKEPKEIHKLCTKLRPEMFESYNAKLVIPVLLQGVTDMLEIRKISKVSPTYIADILVLSGSVWITQEEIDGFVEAYYQKKVKELAYNNKIGEIQKVIIDMRDEDSGDVVRQYKQYKEEMGKVADSGLLGFSTGLKRLDYTTKGLIRGQIWVVGAYYGYGKTFMLLNLIRSAIKQGKRVVFFTLEMKSFEVIARLVGMDAKLDTLQVFQKLKPLDHERRMTAEEYWLNAIATEQLVLVDDVRSPEEILAKMISEEAFAHIDMLGLDYLQLLATGDNQYEALREAMKTVQMVTKQIQCCTVLLSQISNQSQREGQSGSVDGFKGAGDIGQVANVAMKIHRQKAIDGDGNETGEWSNFFGVNVTKVRHGSPKKLEMTIDFPGGNITDILEEFDNDTK